MLTTERDKKTCAKYSARDAKGFVHCNECPLKGRSMEVFTCKAIMHWDRHRREWVYDEGVLDSEPWAGGAGQTFSP